MSLPEERHHLILYPEKAGTREDAGFFGYGAGSALQAVWRDGHYFIMIDCIKINI